MMPTHGFRGFKKMFLGSTFQGVLLRSPIPVLALPMKVLERGKNKFKPPSVILCPIDLEEGSGQLVQTTQQLAEMYGATFTISHSLEMDDELLQMISLNAFTNFKSEAKTKILKEFQGSNHAREIVIDRGPAYENIGSCVDQDSVGMVVLGFSHKSRLRIRTVLYRVVAELSVPVLCVPIDQQ